MSGPYWRHIVGGDPGFVMSGPTWRSITGDEFVVSAEAVGAPEEMLQDVALSFARMSDPWRNPSVHLHVGPDPLGPVNQIIRMMVSDSRGARQIGPARLWPIREGSTVRLYPAPSSRVYGLWGHGPWTVTVDDQVVLEVPFHEALPEIIPKLPDPWIKAILASTRKTARTRARALANRIAQRLGYVYEADIRGDDYW